MSRLDVRIDAAHRPSGRGAHASTRVRRRRRVLPAIALVLVLVAAVAIGPGLGRAVRLTTQPHADEPARVDALLVLYSQPAVYDAALDLIGEGLTDRVFVSAYMGPDGFEKFCGTPQQRDPRLRGVQVECFSPDPVTTQGEVMHASERMRALGLEHLGVLAFPQQVERARILAQRCLPPEDGQVSVLMFEPQGAWDWQVRQDVYGTLAFAKVELTSGCGGSLPRVLQAPLDLLKRLQGQPTVPEPEPEPEPDGAAARRAEPGS